MRLSALFFQTLREAPKEADTVSHKLMLRASLIRQVAGGIYDLLPLGWRSVLKVVAIVREEMNRAGAQEVLMPQLSPRALWEESGRWQAYGKNLMRMKDRHERDFVLGPTHEEVVTDMARAIARTYRKLPVNLYQIATKFRDEIRPRFGVIRSREFMMKDAYSFDRDDAGAEKSYMIMRDAYNRIFTRLGLNYRMVDADSGEIGGSFSQEFMVLADTGEDVLATCTSCKYAANLEKAEPGILKTEQSAKADIPAYHAVPTPGTKSVGMVAKLLGKPAGEIGKILFYMADGELVATMLRGDHVLNETKLKNHLKVLDLALATADKITTTLGVPVGYLGPVGMKPVRFIVDRDLAAMPSIVTGANRVDEHLVDVVPGRDFEVKEIAQLRSAMEGDACPKCGKPLTLIRGIEVGHIFKLGTKYSKSMHAVFLDEGGKEQEMVMGCYGIGITRIVAAAIEQNHDEKGIIWPAALAPYAVTILPLGGEPELMQAAEKIYAELTEAGVEVLLDDRPDAPGVKFADADLMGVPLQVLVGKTFMKEGLVEIKKRGERAGLKVAPGEVLRHLSVDGDRQT
jgi:prolyl-tRNA synthetase